MGNFCGKCGSPLDPVTGKCPKCDPVTPIAQEVVTPIAQEVVTPIAQEVVTPIAQEVVTPIAQPATEAQQQTVNPENMVYTPVYQPKKPKVKRKFPKKFFILLGVGAVVLAIAIWVLFCVLGHNGVVSIPAVDHFLETFGWEYQPKQEAVASSEEEKTEETESQTQTSEETETEEEVVEYEDVTEYYKDKGELKNTISADSSTTAQSEADIYTLLSERGLAGNAITYDCDMSGNYCDDTEIDTYSSTKHPSYYTTYESATGMIWYISVINGTVLANPISYNMESESEVSLYYCETDTVMTYDAASNVFCELVPNADTLKLNKVAKIDSATLDAVTEEALKKL